MDFTNKHYISLHKELIDNLKLEDIRTICSVMDIRFDNLGGETHQVKVSELLAYLRRRTAENSWAQFHDVLETLFPHINRTLLESVRAVQQSSSLGAMRKALMTGKKGVILSAWRHWQQYPPPYDSTEQLWVTALIQIVDKGDWATISHYQQKGVWVDCQQEWLDECVGVLLASGILDVPESATVELVSFLMEIPLMQIMEPVLQERFAEKRTRLAGRLQAKLDKWPVLRPLNAYTPRLPHPFGAPTAEQEYTHLFDTRRSPYWQGHPLYQWLEDTTPATHQIVVGAEGVGRTAMAYGLYAKQSEATANLFTVYIDRAHSLQEIAAELAKHLWHYLLQKPLLLPTHTREYAFLAHLFASADFRYGAVELEQAKRQEGWLAGIDEPHKKKVWRDVGLTNLERLQQALYLQQDYQIQDWTTWLEEYAQAVGLLFAVASPKEKVRLVLDVAELTPNPAHELDKGSRAWWRAGLQIFLFLKGAEVPIQLADWQTHQLRWSAEEMKRLVAHRLARFWRLNERVVNSLSQYVQPPLWSLFDGYIQENALEELVLAANGSPRSAIALCQGLPLAQKQDTITVKHVRYAISRLTDAS